MSNESSHISRERIRAALEEAGRPVTRRQLSHLFDLDKPQSDEFLRPVLMEMVASGELVKNRRAAYGLPSQMDLVSGRISAHPDGYGFVVTDGDSDDLYLAPRQMRQVFNGDRVLAAVTAVDRRGRKEGAVVEVVERVIPRLPVAC